MPSWVAGSSATSSSGSPDHSSAPISPADRAIPRERAPASAEANSATSVIVRRKQIASAHRSRATRTAITGSTLHPSFAPAILTGSRRPPAPREPARLAIRLPSAASATPRSARSPAREPSTSPADWQSPSSSPKASASAPKAPSPTSSTTPTWPIPPSTSPAPPLVRSPHRAALTSAEAARDRSPCDWNSSCQTAASLEGAPRAPLFFASSRPFGLSGVLRRNQHRADRLRIHRLREIISLPQPAPQRLQPFHLLNRLDSLRHHIHL